jgi:hypothetical protein
LHETQSTYTQHPVTNIAHTTADNGHDIQTLFVAIESDNELIGLFTLIINLSRTLRRSN